ncbi:hypothetical protein ACF09E_12280 [Streptomyces sp. NPDC014891]|uniref:hypothetical protein n=1 Tax=Streptomyces sp. NPDC014891 TaxID=3364929 RepID=UPI0036F9B058
MTELLITASQLAQDNRPDGPPWFKWAFLAVWAALLPWVLYKLHQNGYFRRRR